MDCLFKNLADVINIIHSTHAWQFECLISDTKWYKLYWEPEKKITKEDFLQILSYAEYFKSPKQLANYLHKIYQNDTLFNEF